MKKTIATLVAIVVLSFALVLTASAAGYRGPAVQLNQLGLFMGTDTGFSLERAPTRAEAVTMLVRLLGLESTAESGNYSHPFTDLVAWQVPYVSLAYDMGLTTGTSETTFNPGGACTAQMYVTFVARALGYTDNDVSSTLWAEAIAFGTRIGILDDVLNVSPFLRGHMVAVSYLALYVPTADGSFDTLLGKLVDDGAVTASAAAAANSHLSLINEYNLVGAELEGMVNYDLTMDFNIEMAMLGEKVAMTGVMDAAMITDGANIQAAMKYDFSIPMMGMTIEMETYIRDGYVYTNLAGEKTKTSLNDALGMSADDLFSISSTPEGVASSVYEPYMISSITKTTEGAYTVYSVEIAADSINAILDMAMGMMSGIGDLAPDAYSGITVGDVLAKTYVSADGKLHRMSISFVSDMVIDGLDVEASMDIGFVVNATGSDVRITFPADLDSY